MTHRFVLSYLADASSEDFAREAKIAHEEIARTQNAGDAWDQQLGGFFLYVMLPLVLLLILIGIVRNRA
jgi:hypothetical protein